MGGCGKKIHLIRFHVDRNMSDRLDRVSMEKNAVFPADGADLPDRLDGSDLIVGIHDADQASIIPDSSFDFVRMDDSVLMHIQQGNCEAFLFQLLQGMQHRVMFKSGGNDMHLPVFPTRRGG